MMPHAQTADWGIRPVLFTLGEWSIPSYSFFVILGLVAGVLVFWREARLQNSLGEQALYLLLAGLFGGALGAKLPIVVLYWKEIVTRFPDLAFLLSGRSITGGLVGGVVGVVLMKKKLGLTVRTGNLFVPAIAVGVAIGRVGCFLRGCCYGSPTGLPWGVDFGDGIMRHPTQLYEALFMILILGVAFAAVRRLPSGLAFQGFMLTYFSFRFLLEFIRQEEVVGLRLTLFQWISAAVVLYYAFEVAKEQKWV